MNVFFHHLGLCSPLFFMVFIGWGLVKCKVFDEAVVSALSKFVFRFLMPVLLFGLMSHASEMPPVDWRVLIAFFASCIVVFCLGKLCARSVFRLDSTGQVIMGMGGIFANNVQLGVPILQASLGNQAIPTASLIIVFNVLLLWTTATACVEFGRNGSNIDFRKFWLSLFHIFRNPIVLGIFTGTLWGMTGLVLPTAIEKSVSLIGLATTPCALIVVGMGLARQPFRASLPKGISISLFKLVLQPLLVYALCRALDLGLLETHTATVMACLPCAINLYIMACEFNAEHGAASNAICVSTLVSALTVPLTLTLLGVGY